MADCYWDDLEGEVDAEELAEREGIMQDFLASVPQRNKRERTTEEPPSPKKRARHHLPGEIVRVVTIRDKVKETIADELVEKFAKEGFAPVADAPWPDRVPFLELIYVCEEKRCIVVGDGSGKLDWLLEFPTERLRGKGRWDASFLLDCMSAKALEWHNQFYGWTEREGGTLTWDFDDRPRVEKLAELQARGNDPDYMLLRGLVTAFHFDTKEDFDAFRTFVDQHKATDWKRLHDAESVIFHLGDRG